MDLVMSVTVDYTEFNEKSLLSVSRIFGYSISPRTAVMLMHLGLLVCLATLWLLRISVNIYAKMVSLVKMFSVLFELSLPEFRCGDATKVNHPGNNCMSACV